MSVIYFSLLTYNNINYNTFCVNFEYIYVKTHISICSSKVVVESEHRAQGTGHRTQDTNNCTLLVKKHHVKSYSKNKILRDVYFYKLVFSINSSIHINAAYHFLML